ncbi:MAG TPA: hypothetical protein VFP58_00390 [Candidatus Eisenbacteria bacterium]|nr:hypothetical protein [Candidatus Eisenbacteria bacterium]
MKLLAGVFLLALCATSWSAVVFAADPPDSSAVLPSAAPTSAVPPAPADTSAVSSPGATDSPAEAAPSAPITVILRDGTERRYQKVEPWPGDFVRAQRSDGKYDYISKHDIAKITGEITQDVLGRGVAVGKSPQEDEEEDDGPGFFRSGRLPEKKVFPLLQAGILARFDDPPNGDSKNHWFDVGALVNLSPKVALGGTIGIATDYDYSRINFKARLRRWLNKGLAIDVAPGFFIPRVGTPFESGPDLQRDGIGFVTELAVSPSDYLTLSYMVEVVGVDATTYIPGTSIPLSSTTETDIGHFFGLKTGGGFGFLGTGLILLGLFAASN